MYVGRVSRKISWKTANLRRRTVQGLSLDFGGFVGTLLEKAPAFATDYFKIKSIKDQAKSARESLEQQQQLIAAQTKLVLLEQEGAIGGSVGYNIPWIPLAAVGVGGVVLLLILKRRKRR